MNTESSDQQPPTANAPKLVVIFPALSMDAIGNLLSSLPPRARDNTARAIFFSAGAN